MGLTYERKVVCTPGAWTAREIAQIELGQLCVVFTQPLNPLKVQLIFIK